MNKKLLNKTVHFYLLFSVFVMLISAPIFYYFSEKLYIEDDDESLMLGKEAFIQYTLPKLTMNEIPVWNKMNRDIKILKAIPSLKKDSIFFENYYIELNNENEPYRVLVGTIHIENKPFTYFSKINLLENEDLILNIVFLFCFISFLLLVGIFLITRGLSLYLWKPFYNTLEKIEQFKIDDATPPTLLQTDIEEFNRLNTAIDKLIENNIIIYKSQREFIENAAHELQTPLAIFKAKLDTIIQRSDVTEGQFQLLETLNDAAERLNKLNKNLLLLSKLDNHQFTALEKISINKILNNQTPFFEEQALSRNITIQIYNKEEIIIDANPVLVEIVINNLFLNAIKHNIPNGKIEIKIQKNQVSFSNSSDSKPLNTSKLFERFSKTNAASSGNGLGLAIVKKIAKQNQWEINYQFLNNFHFFIIEF